MSLEQHASGFGNTFVRLSERGGYVRSPFIVPGDGATIGAYLLEEGDDVRITDDGDILFNAMVNGVESSASRARKFADIAEQSGVCLADTGELTVRCKAADVPYYLARFFEAADRIAYVSHGMRPRPMDLFDHRVDAILGRAFTTSFTRNASVVGASGHTLRFPFSLDVPAAPILIQTVAAKDGKVDWGSVYKAVGKLSDARSAQGNRSPLFAVLEDAGDGMDQAKNALAATASVVVLRNDDQLVSALRQAA